MIVIDASAAASWLFSDEDDDFTKASSQRALREGCIVPPIFPAELANALLFASRKGRISSADVATALERIAQLPIRIETRGFDMGEELQLANRYRLTAYDVSYLALARRHRLALVTRDAKLQEAASKEKLPA